MSSHDKAKPVAKRGRKTKGLIETAGSPGLESGPPLTLGGLIFMEHCTLNRNRLISNERHHLLNRQVSGNKLNRLTVCPFAASSYPQIDAASPALRGATAHPPQGWERRRNRKHQNCGQGLL